MAAVKIPDMNGGAGIAQPADSFMLPAYQGGSPTNGPIGLDGLLYILRQRPVRKTTGQTEVIAAADASRLVVLDAANAAIALTGMAALWSGFDFAVWNRTGSDYTIPAATGATKHFLSKDGSHSKILAGGIASFALVDVNATRYLLISGETGA